MAKPEALLRKFYDALDEDKFLAKKCPKCGNVEFPPKHACNACGELYLDWIEVSEVTVSEIYKLGSAFTLTQLTPFAPLVGCEICVDGSVDTYSLIFGVNDENYTEMFNALPFKAKLVRMPMGKFYSYAVSINGVLPVRKGEAKQTEENRMWNEMKLSDVGQDDKK